MNPISGHSIRESRRAGKCAVATVWCGFKNGFIRGFRRGFELHPRGAVCVRRELRPPRDDVRNLRPAALRRAVVSTKIERVAGPLVYCVRAQHPPSARGRNGAVIEARPQKRRPTIRRRQTAGAICLCGRGFTTASARSGRRPADFASAPLGWKASSVCDCYET
ncbi:unnamed protein product, partial [Iphiclides podalirius]